MGNGAQKLYWDHLVYSQQRPRSRDHHGWGVRNFAGVLLSAVLFPALLALGAGECGQRWVDVRAADRTARGETLLRDLQDAVSAYPFDEIASDGPSELQRRAGLHADFSVELGVTPMQADVLRVEAVLRDSDTRESLGQFVTYRRRS